MSDATLLPVPDHRGSVLIVDDSRVVRHLVSGYLNAGGFRVAEADDGSTALKMLAAGSYDVVITDLHMPGLDGFAVLEESKRLAPSAEVIILTGTHTKDMDSAVRALRLGAHDYLTKPPASGEVVVLTVEKAMEKKRLRDENKRLLQQMEELSLTDALTGVPNRRAFDRALEQEFTRARRHTYLLGVVMLDIDHFKTVNDTHGHGGGDEVLRSFAQTVNGCLRESDTLFRYGGEEFVVIAPHADGAGLGVAAKRMLLAVERAPVKVASTLARITASAGAAASHATLGDCRDLVSRADGALYEAKRSGRNCVVVSAMSAAWSNEPVKLQANRRGPLKGPPQPRRPPLSR